MIRIVTLLGFVLAVFVGTARADETSDIAGAVAASGYDVPSNASLRNACDADTLCVARFLKDRIGDGAELIPLDETKRKSRGWQKATPALSKSLSDDGKVMTLVIHRFDVGEILGALKQSQRKTYARLTLDIRQMDEKGNLDGMRRVVSLFMGKKKRAFQVRYVAGKVVDWRIPDPVQLFDEKPLTILVGSETDAVGEVFAVLLKSHANAEIAGTQTHARGYLRESIPVAHNWLLRIPVARVHVPGQDMEGGISPAHQ